MNQKEFGIPMRLVFPYVIVLDKYRIIFWVVGQSLCKKGYTSTCITTHWWPFCLEVIKFCKVNSIYLYCLPAHSSHMTQTLDVSFFKSLKTAWGKACDNYRITQKLKPSLVPSDKLNVLEELIKVVRISFKKMKNKFKRYHLCDHKNQLQMPTVYS